MNSKRGFYLALILAVSEHNAWSATIELMPMAGYQLNGGKDLAGPNYDSLDFKNAALRGFSIGYLNVEHSELEFSWTRTYSSAEILRPGGLPSDRIDVRIDQLHLNGLYMFSSDSLQPFLLIGIGGTRYTPAGNRSSTILASAALGGGVKWLWNDHIGLRLDGRWTPALSTRGTHFFCDESGSGECYSTEPNSYISRFYPILGGFEFTSGLLLRY